MLLTARGRGDTVLSCRPVTRRPAEEDDANRTPTIQINNTCVYYRAAPFSSCCCFFTIRVCFCLSSGAYRRNAKPDGPIRSDEEEPSGTVKCLRRGQGRVSAEDRDVSPAAEDFQGCSVVPPPPPCLTSSMAALPNSAPGVSPAKRFLVLFDFDKTIIDESSDDAVLRAVPGQRLPDWLKDSYREGHYNEHMQRVLAFMAEKGVSEDAIRSVVEDIPPTPGIPALFRYLLGRRQDFELAVVSDANVYFIETWLERAGVRHLFQRVFTNPASFDAAGRLVLLPFHSHACPRCPENMCKQAIMREYLASRQQERGGTPFQRVFYVGDGANDICPVLALGPRDTAFPRRDFPMHRLLAEMQQTGFKAGVVPWTSGEDVVDCLQKLLEEK